MKKMLTRFTIAVFIVIQLLGTLLFAKPAQAVLGAGDISFDPTAWVQRERHYTGDKVEATVSESVLSAVMGSLLHATSYFTRKLAYDTALYVAYGGKGRGALAFQDGAGAYFEKVALDTAADAIGELGKPFGLNLCQIPDARLNIFLQVGLANMFAVEPAPNCRWQDLRNGGIFDGDAWKQRYGTEEGLAETFSTTLSVNNTDFGIALGAVGQVADLQAGAEAAARQERSEGDGFKSLTSYISGDIKTPAQIVKEETTALTGKHQGELSAGQIAGIYGSGLKQVPAMAASVFLNTLTATLLNRLLTEGLFPEQHSSGDSRASFSFFDIGINDIQRGKQAFNFLFASKPEPLSNYPIVAEFAACPENPGLNNCVIDSDMQQLLAQAKTGNAITIREALALGLLHGQAPLISPRHQQHGDISYCQNQAYCYSNLQKLRKARVLPLGFEIAALRSDPERPWTLQEVIDGFDDCDRNPNDAKDVLPNPNKPFCHLINPNWVIAIPNIQCEANVYGPQLIAGNSPLRRKECVDMSSCLQKDAQGNCLGYGFCTKEKNIWDIDADICPSYYNTCDTYISKNDGSIASYLSRSLDFGQCTVDSVGCRVYSLTQRANGDWGSSVALQRGARKGLGQNEIIHFNEKIQSPSSVCTADSDGCRAFIPAERYSNGIFVKDENNAYQKDTRWLSDSNQLVYLQRAPEYLGCYDINRAANSPEVNWPTSLQEVQNIVSQDPRCDAYASVCIEEEVGCASYEPVGGGPAIPGVIGEQYVCDATCVGYDTFRQLGYRDVEQGFEDAVFPLHFIPALAEQSMQANNQLCTAAVAGCDEFTNLDDVAAGGEGLEYYTKLTYCEKPADDGGNSAVYYSWEGSVREGFVLQTHRVKPIDQRDLDYIQDTLGNNGNGSYVLGAPMYADDATASLRSAANRCNEARYNIKINNPGDAQAAPDNCHALYNNDGDVYYRLVDELVFVSDACHSLRKTEPEIYSDNTIGAETCTADRGEWNGNSCTRCIGGGEYRNGACIYWTISEPGQSNACPAEANQCRAYAGNTAGNTVNIFSHVFEPGADSDDALLAAREGWQGFGAGSSVRVVSEATDVGLHSLLLEQGSASLALSPTNTPGLESNHVYELSFWARGDAGAIRIEIRQNNQVLATLSDSISIGNTWNRYQAGPVEIGTINSNQPFEVVIRLANGNNRRVFIDNVILTRVQDRLYVIKDSWKTAEGYDAPILCDTNPQDALPGEALGCRAYQETNNKGLVRYATGFERLCREKAVGCEPFWDTYNTVSGNEPELAHVYNLWCAGPEGQECQITIGNTRLGSCIVERESINEAGQTGCYIKQNNSLDITLPEGSDISDLPAGSVIDSTVYVPSDTPTSTPMFLANKEEHRCQEAQRGCELVGSEEQRVPDDENAAAYEHVEVRVKNDPSLYDTTLCSDTLVGCGEFVQDGVTFYFKDPRYNGNRLCSYREQQGTSGSYGWFLSDPAIGQCASVGNLCTSNDDCAQIGGRNNNCTNQGNVACYPDEIERGGRHSLLSNSSENYDGLVGVCAPQYNGCTELIDPVDTSNVNPDGTPYYVIMNDRITSRLSECTQVSLSEGCVLFDRTDDPNKLFNAEATYALSENQDVPYSPVAAVTTPTNNDLSSIDSNLLLKVRRDRSCSEWLACRTSIPVVIEETGETRYACYQYQACDALGENGASCGSWVNDTQTPQDQQRALIPLGYDQYITRDVSWYAEDFSGYSLYGKYQITNMAYLGLSFPDNGSDRGNVSFTREAKKTYIVREIKQSLFDVTNRNDVDCVDPAIPDMDWRICGMDGGGRCYNERCLYPIDGSFSTVVPNGAARDSAERWNAVKALVQELDTNQCKGFPEEDSPFPFEVAAGLADNNAWQGVGDDNPQRNGVARREVTDKKPGFESVNVCQDGNCSCSYEKIRYESGTADYWPTDSQLVQNGYQPAQDSYGICVGGDYNGSVCERSVDCQNQADRDGDGQADGEPGTCSKREQTDTKIGIEGFCLEYDFSRPLGYGTTPFACLTWLPIQTSASRVDIYNTDIQAGYYPTEDSASGYGEVYCLASTAVTQGPSSFEDDVLADYPTYFLNGNNQPDIWYSGTIARSCDMLGSMYGGLRGDYAELMCSRVTSRVSDNDVAPEDGGQDPGCFAWFDNPNAPAEDMPDVCDLDELKEDRCSIIFNQENGDIEDHPMNRASRCEAIFDEAAAQPDAANNVLGLGELTLGAKIASLVQEWAFRTIGTNAHVLRAEAPDFLGYISLDGRDRYLQYQPTAKNLGIYHLVPAAHTPGRNNGQATLGILRHPPRVFGDVQVPVSGPKNEYGRSIAFDQLFVGNQSVPAFGAYFYEQPAKGIGQEVRTLDTVALSPGNRLMPSFGENEPESITPYNRSLYRSSYEGFLRESDIDKLYFVTTKITGGLDGQFLPPLFYDDLYIDFTLLRQMQNERDQAFEIVPENGRFDLNEEGHTYTGTYMNGGVYRASFCEKTGGASSANEEFPRFVDEAEHGGCESHRGERNGFPADDTAIKWTYLLQGEVGDDEATTGIAPQGVWYDANGQIIEQLDPERNRVFRRYVLVYLGTFDATAIGDEHENGLQEGLENGIPALGDPEQNPFHKDACPINDVPDTENWFAIGLDFNEDGEFLGYISSSCNTDSRSASPQLAVVATLNAQCTEFAKVYNDPDEGPLEGDTNKAWTDRLWEGAKIDRGYGVPFTTPHIPFGSLPIDGASVSSNEVQNLRQHSFAIAMQDGIPLSCREQLLNMGNNIIGISYVKPDARTRCHEYVINQGADIAINRATLSGKTRDNAVTFLNSLFAKVYTRVHFLPQNIVNYVDNVYQIEQVNRAEDSGQNVAGLTPPQVYSLNPVTCQNAERCSAGEKNNITIGTKNGTNTDYNGDGVADEADINGDVVSILSTGSYLAVAKFFAFADDNRMPIRRVMFDWADGSDITNDGRKGLYKNRQPACLSSDAGGEQEQDYCALNGVITGIACEKEGSGAQAEVTTACPIGQQCIDGATLAADNSAYGDDYKQIRFGATSRACKEGYFEFVHEYTCDNQMIQSADPRFVRKVATLGADRPRLYAAGLGDEDSVCVFQPRVQVMDNWGWCNGSCVRDYDANGNEVGNVQEGCYDEFRDPDFNTIGQCSQLPDGLRSQPWTSYQGRIIVIPSSS